MNTAQYEAQRAERAEMELHKLRAAFDAEVSDHNNLLRRVWKTIGGYTKFDDTESVLGLLDLRMEELGKARADLLARAPAPRRNLAARFIASDEALVERFGEWLAANPKEVQP